MKPLYVPQFETLNVINEEEKKAYSEIEKQNFKSCRTNASGFDLRVDKVEWFLIICDK